MHRMIKKGTACFLAVLLLAAVLLAPVCAKEADALTDEELEEIVDRMLAEREDFDRDIVATLRITREDVGSLEGVTALFEEIELPFPVEGLGTNQDGSWMVIVVDLFEEEFREELLALLRCELVSSVEFDNLPKIPEPRYEPGDVNLNGKLDVQDYMMLKRYLLGTFALTHEQKVAADFDRDWEVHAKDYMKLKRYLLEEA